MWILPEDSVSGRPGARPFHEGRDRLEASDPRVVPVHDLDLPAARLGVARVHAEKLRREERGLVAAGARADLQEHVARVLRVLRKQEDFQLLLDLGQARRQRRALGRRELVELVSGRQGLGHLPRPLQLPLDAPVLLGLRDDRLEFGERLLRVAHGAVVLDELRVGQAAPDLFVLAADLFEFFEHQTEPSAVSPPLSARQDLDGTARERSGMRAETGAASPFPYEEAEATVFS